VLGVCVVCYGVSFGQMLLPLPTGVKSVLWVLFFGLAKCAQYAALLILGKEGIRRVRMMVTRRG
ncbi:MAG: HAD family hydrolase, partial [Muribaculaceae bacterium]|nr:HAD family hydrolase [Muribaculaceae bacterium]